MPVGTLFLQENKAKILVLVLMKTGVFLGLVLVLVKLEFLGVRQGPELRIKPKFLFYIKSNPVQHLASLDCVPSCSPLCVGSAWRVQATEQERARVRTRSKGF